jgi:NAD(P)-dependent dehydrogenase (short-subunit alcohol dehydrogenase family)
MKGTSKSIVITGASSGIGRTTALEFARDGHFLTPLRLCVPASLRYLLDPGGKTQRRNGAMPQGGVREHIRSSFVFFVLFVVDSRAMTPIPAG